MDAHSFAFKVMITSLNRKLFEWLSIVVKSHETILDGQRLDVRYTNRSQNSKSKDTTTMSCVPLGAAPRGSPIASTSRSSRPMSPG